MVKNKNKNSVGRSVIKDRFQSKHRHDPDAFVHNSELHKTSKDYCSLPVRSITEESNLTEFFTLADLAGAEYEAERRNVTIVDANKNGVLSAAEKRLKSMVQEQNRQFLKIPRRPKWTTEMSAGELDNIEKNSFLEWRRQLAKLEAMEHIVLTPFEKNIDFWRQLWRVVERSDVVVQIVDGRNPLLFRCEDLELYVKEVDSRKVNLLLVNKADLLTEKQRRIWWEYFSKQNVTAIFWSAKLAEETISKLNCSQEDEEKQEETNPTNSNHETSDEDEDSIEESAEEKSQGDIAESTSDMIKQLDIKPEPYRLYTVEELIDLFVSINEDASKPVTVGLVGYPNVGKSSSLNVLFKTKKAAVSATPGRTKHFQTLIINENLTLCDCPGLVMPSFAHSKEELIISGILPIDNMRDCVAPISLICSQFPRCHLESLYGVIIPPPKEGEDPHRSPTGREFLTAHAYMHGLMSSKGNPHLDRSSRQVLKDYVNGKLLYRHSPPGVSSEEEFESIGPLPDSKKKRLEVITAKKSETSEEKISDFDRLYFQNNVASYGYRGKASQIGSLNNANQIKPNHKKHFKMKKDKLRRIHADLDKHT